VSRVADKGISNMQKGIIHGVAGKSGLLSVEAGIKCASNRTPEYAPFTLSVAVWVSMVPHPEHKEAKKIGQQYLIRNSLSLWVFRIFYNFATAQFLR
jgi:hypothetical protein